MNFKQRFSRYFIGIIIGVMLSFVIFGKRSCGKWLPDSRVRQTIAEKTLRFTPEVLCMMDCHGFSEKEVELLTLEGNVVYNNSEPRATPQRYYLKGEKRAEIQAAMIELRDSASVVIELFPRDQKSCGC